MLAVLLMAAGAALICVGLTTVSVAAGLCFAGACLVLAGVDMARP